MKQANAVIDGFLAQQIPSPQYQNRVNSLIEKLGHKVWKVREQATVSLTKIGAPALPFVDKALSHPDPEIRSRAQLIIEKMGPAVEEQITSLKSAIAVLSRGKDKRVVSKMIALLEHPSVDVRYALEYSLRQTTGRYFGYRAHADRKSRTAAANKWRAWWKKAEARFVFAKHSAIFGKPIGVLITGNGTLRVTLVTLEGKVIWARPAKGKTYCAIGLPNGNTLVSDYGNGVIREYDKSGKLVWDTTGIELAGSVHGMQRLANGNLLIAHTDGHRVIEVTRKKDIVWTYRNQGSPASAQRLANGNTLVCLWSGNKVVEVTSSGKIVWEKRGLSVPHDAVKLPNGNVLIADFGNSRVIEVDPKGREVWGVRKRLGGPSSVSRLPDGRTVIGDFTQGVIIVDRKGQLVKQLHRQHNPGKASIVYSGL